MPLIFAGGFLAKTDAGSSAFVYIQDIFPPLCELAGVDTPTSVSGTSLAGVIQGRAESVRDHTYHAYMQFQRAYRHSDYMLIAYVRAPGQDRAIYGDAVRGSRVTPLFNFREDPWETHNLAVYPAHADRLAQMRTAMKEAAHDYGDEGGPLINYDFDFWTYY